MTVMTYTLVRFVNDLRGVVAATKDPLEITSRVRSLVHELALAKTWLEPRHYACDAEQGFGAHLLHEEPDHSLAVLVGGLDLEFKGRLQTIRLRDSFELGELLFQLADLLRKAS